MTETEKLLCDTQKIRARFDAILKKDAEVDRIYAQQTKDIENGYHAKLAEIEQKYRSGLSALGANRRSMTEAAVSRSRASQLQLQSALRDVIDIENGLPKKLADRVNKRRGKTAVPQRPDLQVMAALLRKINDPSITAAAKRGVRYDGYYRLGGMVGDFLEKTEAAKLYIAAESQKNDEYVKQATARADQEYKTGVMKAEQEKAAEIGEADRKKREFNRQNDELYRQNTASLQADLDRALSDPVLLQFDRKYLSALDRMGAYEDEWKEYVPAETCPNKLLLGAMEVPLAFPAPVERLLREKLPVSYRGSVIAVPFFAEMDKPVSLYLKYTEQTKQTVMSGVQGILLKLLKLMPPALVSVVFVDPNQRGANLGVLNDSAKANAQLGISVVGSKEEITKQFKELESHIGITVGCLKSSPSLYDYNKTASAPLAQKFVVINDFPDNFERSALESLAVLVTNAEKCGVSLIFASKEDRSQVPVTIPGAFTTVDCSGNTAYIFEQHERYAFVFDPPGENIGSFVESMRSAFSAGLKVDNSFASLFDFDGKLRFRDSTEAFSVPFAVDARRHIVELDLGGSHALLSGRTKSGKSTALHMLISSIMMHYRPDDVELWLIDYNKVEFAEYAKDGTPHVKFVGLEDSAEFTFSFLEYLQDTFLQRMDVFKKKGCHNITEYKRTEGTGSIPRIVLIIDEFHKMTQAIASEKHYVTILENALSEYRKFGLSCVFSDQAISDGLRGLTEKGKKQIAVRLAMENDQSEIKETLVLPGSIYTEELTAKMNRMVPGDIIFKRLVEDEAGETQIVLDIYKSVHILDAERRMIRSAVNKSFAGEKQANQRKPVLIDGIGRSRLDMGEICAYESECGLRTPKQIPVYVGTPSTLECCFHFELRPQMDANIMIIGAEDELRASVVIHSIYSFTRVQNGKILVFADPEDEIYRGYIAKIERSADSRVEILTSVDEICRKVGVLKTDGAENKTLIVWLGLESISEELCFCPQKEEAVPVPAAVSDSSAVKAVDDMLAGIENMLASYDTKTQSAETNRRQPASDSKPAGGRYDARDDIQELVLKGPRRNIHTLAVFASVKMLKQVKFLRLENFEHKIAFHMSIDDSITYLGKGSFASDIEDSSAVYYDGGSSVRSFRPYLL